MKVPAVDLILEVLTKLALLPGPGTVTIKWRGSRTVEAVMLALSARHLSATTSRGKKREKIEVRACARALIRDILLTKKDWKPHAGIFATFAAHNDRMFFEMLGRGIYRGTKPVFSELDWFLLLNWHEWNSPLPPVVLKAPPLKFWTSEATLQLVNEVLDMNTGLELAVSLEKRRTRLALELSRPAKVNGALVCRDGSIRISKAD